MKQTAQQKAKQKLINYYSFKEVDFFELDGIIYLNCKDSVMIKATDVYETLNLERKEEYENIT